VVWIGPEMTPWLERGLGDAATAQLRLLGVEGTHLQDFGAFGASEGHDHGHDHAGPRQRPTPMTTGTVMGTITGPRQRLTPMTTGMTTAMIMARRPRPTVTTMATTTRATTIPAPTRMPGLIPPMRRSG
jgi:hypothetical protein